MNIENICYDKFKEKWYNDLTLNDHSKLRTYRLFKNEYGKENDLLKNIPGKYKSAYAKFRCGVAPSKNYKIKLIDWFMFNANFISWSEKKILNKFPIETTRPCTSFLNANWSDNNTF